MIKACTVEVSEVEIRFEAPVLFGFMAILAPLVAVIAFAGLLVVLSGDLRIGLALRSVDPVNLMLDALLLAVTIVFVRTVFWGRTATVFDSYGLRNFIEVFGIWVPRATVSWSRLDSVRLEEFADGELQVQIGSRARVGGLEPHETRAVYEQLLRWLHSARGRRPTSASS